jgi:hypothetical protein
MANASVTVDIDQPLNVLAYLAPQITLHDIVPVDAVPQATYLVFGEILDPPIRIYSRILQDLVAPGATDAIDICQSNLDSLVARQINSCNSRHVFPPSNLSALKYGL